MTGLCSQLDPQLNEAQRKDIGSNTEFILINLVEKLGDNLAKVRLASEEAIIMMCNHRAFGPKICIFYITKKPSISSKTSNSSLGSKKTMNSNKLIIGKYLTLSRILIEVQGLSVEQLRSCLPFTVQGLTHSL